MKQSVLLTLALAINASATSEQQKHPVRQALVDQIKQKATTWTPQEVKDNHLSRVSADRIFNRLGNLGTAPNPFEAFTESMDDVARKVQAFLGVADQAAPSKKKLKQSLAKVSTEPPAGLPKFFSWREKTPECIGPIEDQGDCGACWAFTSSGLLADRFCIHTNGAIKTRMSPQEMVNCNYENFGCVGGYLTNTIDYLQTEGLVPRECMTYKEGITSCTYRCDNGQSTGNDRYYCKIGSMVVATTHEEIMRELSTNGPMMVGLMIYEDFMNYESGIYSQEVGEQLGGHAMKLIGYGHDEKVGLYWELQNQWSEDWGEKGFVRIKAGEIGIDSVALSCLPDLI